MDTSDPRHFGPKTVRHYIFGTEMSYFLCWCRSVFGTLWHWCRTVSTFYEGAEVSNGHFGTSAELSQHFMKGPKCPTDISALVLKCLRQIGDALFLYRFTTSRHICTIHRDLLTASQDILYIRNHTRTFTFDS